MDRTKGGKVNNIGILRVFSASKICICIQNVATSIPPPISAHILLGSCSTSPRWHCVGSDSSWCCGIFHCEIWMVKYMTKTKMLSSVPRHGQWW